MTTTGPDCLVKGIEDRQIYAAISHHLAPVLDATTSVDVCESLLNELLDRCNTVMLPLREFVESELADYDYQYNDIVGFDAGKWSAELTLMLEKDIHFKAPNSQMLDEVGRPIWVLSLQLSLVFPVFIMAVEKWELSKTRSDWIDCSPDNARFRDFSDPIRRCLANVVQAGFSSIPKESLNKVPTDEELPSNKNRLNVAQLLFNEVFGEDLDILSFD